MSRGDDSGDNSKDHKEWGEDVKTQQEGGQMAWLPLLSGGGQYLNLFARVTSILPL